MKQTKAPERLEWAVDRLDVKPNEQLLEIGCGHGVAVSLVCEKLKDGHILAIDQSAKMIAMAKKRNTECVAASKASFQTVSLRDADFGETKFDKIFAIRVGVFVHGEPSLELEVIRKHLAPKGSFYLFYDPVVASQAEEIAEDLKEMLVRHKFNIKKILTTSIAQSKVVCVIAGK